MTTPEDVARMLRHANSRAKYTFGKVPTTQGDVTDSQQLIYSTQSPKPQQEQSGTERHRSEQDRHQQDRHHDDATDDSADVSPTQAAEAHTSPASQPAAPSVATAPAKASQTAPAATPASMIPVSAPSKPAPPISNSMPTPRIFARQRTAAATPQVQRGATVPHGAPAPHSAPVPFPAIPASGQGTPAASSPSFTSTSTTPLTGAAPHAATGSSATPTAPKPGVPTTGAPKPGAAAHGTPRKDQAHRITPAVMAKKHKTSITSLTFASIELHEDLPVVREYSAGGLIFDENDRVAVIARHSRSGHLEWCLPKGHIEKGETPEQTAVREVHEETGIMGEIIESIATIDYWFTGTTQRIHKLVHHFALHMTGGELSVNGDPDHEAEDVMWVNFDDLADVLSYPNERRIATMYARKRKNHG